MPTPYLLIAALTLIELLLCYPRLRYRRQIALFNIPIVIGSTIALLLSGSLFGLVFAVLSMYRLINLARQIKPRRNEAYLFTLSRSSSIALVAAQLLVVAGAYLSSQYPFMATVALPVGMVFLATSTLLLLSTIRASRTTRPLSSPRIYSDHELPTLSVLIPARNETDDLVACLKSLVSSTYPKLEIIVLDDCSQNSRTPEIIRGFAHDGVRFLNGKDPAPNWLAKNHAYSKLAASASGELLLFCGVDARFKPESLRLLVASLLDKKKTMMSLLPANTPPPASEFEPLLVQPNRYAWELVPPRRWFSRPPVLSTCWIMYKKTFDEAGGFAACSRSISPERYLARYAANHNDGYSFMQSDTETGVASNKPFDEQQATAIRTRYPQLHQRLELTALVSIAEFSLLVIPFIMLLGSISIGDWSAAALMATSVLLLTILYVIIMQLTYRKFLFRSLWLLPFAALYDIGILNYSMFKYEFSEVIWKGRNVCVPVMHVIARLPKVD